MPVRARMEVPPLTGFATRPGKMYLLLFVQRSVYSRRWRERDGTTIAVVELWGQKGMEGEGKGKAERWRPRGLLEVEVEKKLPGDGHDDAEYKFQRRSHLRSPVLPLSRGAALLLFGFFDPQSGSVNKLDDHPEEIPMPRRRNTTPFSRQEIPLTASRNMKFDHSRMKNIFYLILRKYTLLFSFFHYFEIHN